MPPSKDPRKAGGSRATKSPERPKTLQSSKKFSSLSSFQPTLNFSTAPKPGPSTSTVSSKDNDSRSMPPPPAGVKGKGLSHTPLHSTVKRKIEALNENQNAKGKEKAVNGEMSDDEDEDVPQFVGASMRSESDMWTDRYAPTTEAALAPGKARIAKVKAWLHEALYGVPENYVAPPGGIDPLAAAKLKKYRRLLLLTGPAGVGKTTTLRVISKEMKVDLVEWDDSIEERSLGATGFDRESPMSKLSAFLMRNAFKPLSLSSQSSSSPSSSKKLKKPRPRVLVLTSLPNLSHQPTKDAFHNLLLQFCQAYTPSSCPLVIVHSSAGSSGRAEESWMDRDRAGRDSLFDIVGREVKDGPWCREVDFIALAPSFLIKALNSILDQALPRAKHPESSAVQLIALTCNGDLRSAINSLQLLCSQSSSGSSKKRKKGMNGDGDGKSVVPKKVKYSKGAKLDVSRDLRVVLDMVTRREQSLNLFHALGRVLMNKRITDPGIEEADGELYEIIKALPETDQMPQHLYEFERPKSMVQIEGFLPIIPVDASSFALWLHQALPLYCDEIEEVGDALEELCRADMMRSDDDLWQSNPQAIAYALHIMVRGIHMALPSPVPSSKSTRFRKPQFFEAFRQERENLGSLDLAAGHLAKKGVHTSIKLASEKEIDDDLTPWGGVSSRSVLSTELLPMMIKIQALSSRPLLPAALKSMAMPPYSTVHYEGVELRSDDMRDGEEDAQAPSDDQTAVVDTSGWIEDTRDEEVQDLDRAEEDIEEWIE